jgi:8-oxo-dGTP pyrophosphatase MutT (NUDIX family)
MTVEENTPQVQILSIVGNKSIVMVRVYRPVLADTTLELPAGGAKGDERPVETAVREFREETGIVVSDLSRFEVLPPLAHTARSPILPYTFQIHLSGQEFDSRMDHDDEIVEVKCFSYEEVLRKIEEGEFYIGPQIAIVMKYLLRNKIIKQTD